MAKIKPEQIPSLVADIKGDNFTAEVLAKKYKCSAATIYQRKKRLSKGIRGPGLVDDPKAPEAPGRDAVLEVVVNQLRTNAIFLNRVVGLMLAS